ncbi:MAG: hypothetical protein JWQ38_21 [Flavipsychrobacter sp.]|nr:hypothetical protein [Flavipsychrobacter sp.]
MKYTLSLLIVCCCIIAPSTLSAQYYLNQNKVWAFGVMTGLDFNFGSPVFISTGLMGKGMPEGCATVSDPSGNLLFYSGGEKVYNKTGSVMPSGSSIVSFPTISTEQAAVIIPFIGSHSKYYIFSLASIGYGHLAYSIVDMALDGGLGDVVTSSMGTPLQDSLGENMIAIPGNHNNIWLVTHKQDTSMFLAFNVTSTGISTPVRSAVGPFNGHFCYGWGMLRGSTDRRKIAQGILSAAGGGCYGAILYDFDPSTGIVSNCRTIDTANNNTYAIEFSADNTKLYSNGDSGVIQYNIALPTLTEIQASKFVVTDSSYGADLRLGPDGKIYFRGSDTHDLHCISFPNLVGSACSFTSHAVKTMSDLQYQTFPSLYVVADAINVERVSEIKTTHNTSIYPNPATTILNITSSDVIINVAIANLVGQTVYSNSYQSEEVQVNVSGLPSGMYLVRINGTEVRKFVKE